MWTENRQSLCPSFNVNLDNTLFSLLLFSVLCSAVSSVQVRSKHVPMLCAWSYLFSGYCLLLGQEHSGWGSVVLVKFVWCPCYRLKLCACSVAYDVCWQLKWIFSYYFQQWCVGVHVVYLYIPVITFLSSPFQLLSTIPLCLFIAFIAMLSFHRLDQICILLIRNERGVPMEVKVQ